MVFAPAFSLIATVAATVVTIPNPARINFPALFKEESLTFLLSSSDLGTLLSLLKLNVIYIFSNNNYYTIFYLAYSIILFSLMTVTFISPGYLSSCSIFFAISRARRSEEHTSEL